MLCIIIYTFEKITCPRCFSTDIYRFGKNNFGIQKYQCKHCKRQFTLEKPISKSKGYPKCPICHKATYIWHKYDTYLHFKCGNRKCNYSFKLPIEFEPKLLKSFNFKTKMSFKRFRHPANIILLALTLYFDGNSSTRAIKRILKAIYNLNVSHVTIWNWTKSFAGWFNYISNKIIPFLNFNSDEWHADETYVKIKGIDYYLWILLDSETRFIISFVLSPSRGSTPAYQLFKNATSHTRASPTMIITDNWDAYNQATALNYPKSIHHKYSAFSDDLNNNFIESFNKTFKAWYKTKKGFKNFESAVALITTFIYYYNFLHEHSSLNNLTPAMVAGLNYSTKDIKNWMLF